MLKPFQEVCTHYTLTTCLTTYLKNETEKNNSLSADLGIVQDGRI